MKRRRDRSFLFSVPAFMDRVAERWLRLPMFFYSQFFVFSNRGFGRKIIALLGPFAIGGAIAFALFDYSGAAANPGAINLSAKSCWGTSMWRQDQVTVTNARHSSYKKPANTFNCSRFEIQNDQRAIDPTLNLTIQRQAIQKKFFHKGQVYAGASSFGKILYTYEGAPGWQELRDLNQSDVPDLNNSTQISVPLPAEVNGHLDSAIFRFENTANFDATGSSTLQISDVHVGYKQADPLGVNVDQLPTAQTSDSSASDVAFDVQTQGGDATSDKATSKPTVDVDVVDKGNNPVEFQPTIVNEGSGF